MAWIPVAFGFIGLIWLKKLNPRLFYYLLAWIILPYLAIAFFSKVIYPRYLLFFGSIIIILAGFYFSQLKNNFFSLVSYLLILVIFLYYSFTIIFRPALLPFPEIDRGQYIEGATAGWGVKEIVDYVREKSKEKPVILLAEGNFGLIGDVLDVFVKPQDKIIIKGYWPLEEKALLENQKELDKNYVFAVFAQRKEFPFTWPLIPVKKFDKPGRKSATYLFELRR
ncbi:hypothetical protein HYW87_00780 [Candidatus Roizmanbacteria bacterium]|nr:hypothetical protein [Candidatus Roizmanbacteria bacterium]